MRVPAAATLRRGATGGAVRALQLKLVARGFLSKNDFLSGAGVFGPRTETAVKRAQVEAGLPVTGLVDARTLSALSAERPASRERTAATDVFEKPAILASAMRTLTDDDDDFTTPMGEGLRAAHGV